MKKAIFLLLLGGALVSNPLNAQKEKQITPLKVGDPMPNLVLDQIGEVVYNKTGANKFSDLKGKLVILDFWNTRCGSCIGGFPHMEKLQKQFGDSIQVIFVNPEQNQKEIVQDLGKTIKVDPFPYDVMQIVNAKLLGQLFPYEYSGTQVWIDPKGTLRIVNGNPMVNHSQKIREVLAGKDIWFAKMSKGKKNNPGILYKSTSYFQPTQQNSFYPFCNEYGANEYGFPDVVDSVTKTIRSSYVNYQMLNLYRAVLYNDILKSWENEIFTAYNVPYLNKVFFDVKDTLRYTASFLGEKRRDIDWVQSVHCYEQILPFGTSPKMRKQYMLEDLNRYFGSLYGTTVKVETINKSCFLLVVNSTSQLSKLKAGSSKGIQYQAFEENGKKMARWYNVTLPSLMQGYSQIIYRETKEKPFFDETNFSDKIDIVLPDPSELHSIDDLKAALRPYGLDIITGDKKLDMIAIRDNKN